MNAKNLVLDFYQPDVMLDKEAVKQFIHPDITIEWNSSKGFVQMNYDDVLNLSDELKKSYVRLKTKISHIFHDKDKVSVRYSYFVKTIENPREEMLLANFMVIWEIKDQKLFRGYQMSQF
jgi:ADP-heptose:LPS heptosyltransferase